MLVVVLALVAAGGLAGTVVCALAIRRARVAERSAQRLAADAVERRFNVLEAVADGIYIIDESFVITHVNEEAERLLRSTSIELVGSRLDEVVDPLASELVPDIAIARKTGEVLEHSYEFSAADRTVEVRIKPAARETLVYLRDVSARARAATRLEESEQRLQLVTQNVDAVLWTAGRDARFSTVTGGALDELGLRSSDLLDEPVDLLVARRYLDEAFTGVPVRAEAPHGERWLRHHLEPIIDHRYGDVNGAVGVSIDITELKRAEQRAWEAANRDRLTGLPNRLALEESLGELLVREGRDGKESRFALLFVDVDRFKAINDTLGHDVGDEVLRIVADRIAQAVREGDVVARPGGDEFIALLPRIASVADVDIVAQRIIRLVRRPIALGGREMVVGASIGVALFPEHGRTTRALVSRADMAMYRAKRAGGNVHAHFEPAMESEAAERLTVETELRRALERGELRVHYQPIVETETTRLVGCEALVRWQHPHRGLLLPEHFLGVAEETGLIVEIDRWVIAEAMRDAGALRAAIPDFALAVNASPRALRIPGFGEEIVDTAARHGFPLEALTLEITEQIAVDASAVPLLDGLAAAGVTLAIDDFGVGYSSLAYLARLPIGVMKLDRSFLSGITDNPRSRLLVRSIVQMAQGLALQVVAEGVEADDELRFVRSIGCDFAQGYCFSKPLPLTELVALLAREQGDVRRPRPRAATPLVSAARVAI
ncbi:MAG TPA: EAL domain-containing protein [Candidatus Sulfotelmatobacter sp.]|nr:EAL domain-containing protein [Candidatus Sulfotelmatobacter sp.]